MENQNFTTEKTDAGQGMSIASLVLGILGLITAFIPCFGFFSLIFGVLAIIFGVIGLKQAKKGNGKTGMPMAGLILGIISTAFIIIWLIVFAGIIATSAASQMNL